MTKAAKCFLSVGLAVFLSLSIAQRPGDEAPDFTLVDSSGEVLRLSDYRSRPVLLNFWATWCPPCQEELPLLQEMAGETPELTVLLVNAGEGLERAATYLEANGLTLPTAVDATDSQRERLEGVSPEGTLEVVRRYRVRGMPTTFFIDAEGVIEGVFVGQLAPQTVADHLSAVGVTWEP